MSTNRLPGAFKDIPTTFEQGHTIEWLIWRGLYVGPKVTDAEYAWWVETLGKLQKTPEFEKEREARGLFAFNRIGADFDRFVKADVARFRTWRRKPASELDVRPHGQGSRFSPLRDPFHAASSLADSAALLRAQPFSHVS